jgi:hypothetical protein
LTANFFKKSLIKNANLFRKGLIENSVTFGFEYLIPKHYQRDQPAQRLRFNGCGAAVVAWNLN